MNAALAARQLECKKGAQSKRTHLKVNRKIPSQKKLGIEAIEQQIQLNGMHKPSTTNSTDDIHQGTQTTLTSLIIKGVVHAYVDQKLLKSNKIKSFN
jgi:hypothetical protein